MEKKNLNLDMRPLPSSSPPFRSPFPIPSYRQNPPNIPAMFHCERCGDCCAELVGQFGMMLSSSEARWLTHLANVHHVSIDVKPLAKGVLGNIILWQLATSPCPFLTNIKNCLIYENRPTFCKMFPIHPYGVGKCNGIRHTMQCRPKKIVFPEETKLAARLFLRDIYSRIKEAEYVYSLDKGWIPKQKVKAVSMQDITDGDLKYADTYEKRSR